MHQPDIMTEENIERAYIIMAKIVRDHGEKYMPIFQRMHEIRTTYKSEQNLRNVALQIAEYSLE
jgi:hypothetical protein